MKTALYRYLGIALVVGILLGSNGFGVIWGA
jgi:hypothetical protein